MSSQLSSCDDVIHDRGVIGDVTPGCLNGYSNQYMCLLLFHCKYEGIRWYKMCVVVYFYSTNFHVVRQLGGL